MIRRAFTTVAVLLTFVGLNNQAAKAANPHIDETALAVRNTAAQICNELRFHYQGSAFFSHAYRDAYQMYAAAVHAHDVAHHSHNLVHLRNDVAELNERFHHLEEMVGVLNDEFGIAPVMGFDPRFSGYSQSHGAHTNVLNQLVNTMSLQLHCLREDVDSLGFVPAPPVGYGTPVYPVQTFPKKAKKNVWLNANPHGFGISIAIP